MRFHKLEMVGFKSFVDKTSITFESGMTAVVGPNGCGKSNISDAIRWVLGEKSAKNMRGEKMEDVIFNGSEVRKPHGMAEVTLTFINDGEGTLGFTEFREINITRRLYRDGNSEYFINKISCRLKDVRDLLIDVGVGSKAYAIIEQGKIGQLVQSKPEERRYIIEEVAGITKYKSRKVEALSKLRETEDNLNRVNDIVVEVKRQIGSLDRQAKKAERYKKLAEELRGIELKLAWDDYQTFTAGLADAEEEHLRLSDEEGRAKSSVTARDADLSEARIKLSEREMDLMNHQREVHRVESEISRLEARAEVAVNQLKSLDEREERMREEYDRLGAEQSELDNQSMSMREEQLALKKELEDVREALRAVEADFQEKAELARSIESDIESQRSRLFEIQAEISSGTNRLTRLEERKSNIEAQARRAQDEERETAEKLSELQLAIDKKKMEIESIAVSQAELEEERAISNSSIQNTKASIKELDHQLTKARDEHNRKSARLHSLRELEEKLEGYGEGIKALMKEKKAGTLSGIRLLVADLLQTESAHEKAIEAALGDRLQNVVVDGHEDAVKAISILMSRRLGRGTFVPVASRITRTDANIPAGDGIIGPAVGLIKPKDGYVELLSSLLAGVVVVKDMDTALGIWNGGYTGTIVTLDGELLEPSGSLSGGGPSAGGGILSKKREIRELIDEVETLSQDAESIKERLTESRSNLEYLEVSLKETNELINEKRLIAVASERDYHAIKNELDRYQKKSDVLGIESAQRAQEELEIRENSSLLRLDIEKLNTEKQRKDGYIQESQEELKALRSNLEREREGVTVRKMELSSLVQRDESSARDLKRADLMREDLRRRIDRLKEEGVDIAKRRQELASGRKEAEDGINGMMKTVLSMKEMVPELQNAYEAATAAIASLEEAVKVARRDAEGFREAVTELELRRAELKLKAEHVAETVHHNYHIGIPEIDEATRAMEIVRDDAEMNASELRIKIERIGPVNIGAIEEYNELMERYTFLTTQKEDLESSLRRLREAITKINKTSEELFMEAFNAINEKFKIVFLSLFGGGRAELLLLPAESGDVLDSGLEIVAQPPGKKLQGLMLFSGGEKALIAAALTFACFLVKTSPFCVLDEVDAPLDEANVLRFGRMLKDFAGHTQFIVITHSRPTMELADALFGVTMREPGVSSLVSVKLKEAEVLVKDPGAVVRG